MESATLIIVLVIALALFFDFTNGFHDTANAMATSIATEALPPRTAVVLSGVLNLVGAFLTSSCPEAGAPRSRAGQVPARTAGPMCRGRT